MSVDEENALHYIGGYTIRSLTKKIQKLKTDHVDEMLVSLLYTHFWKIMNNLVKTVMKILMMTVKKILTG